MIRNLIPLFLLSGCGGAASDVDNAEDSAVWMSGFSYNWQFFNHRLSLLDLRVDDQGVRAGVVGGTSTSGLEPELPTGCEASACDELPFVDFAELQVDWGRVVGADARFSAVTASLTADADGETTTVSAVVPGAGEGPVTAVIRGLRLNTDHPLDGEESCYLPRNGWLPTLVRVSVGEPEVIEGEVSVEVEAAFAAGKTLEEMRACIDEVVDRARVAVDVDVLIISGGGATASAAVSEGAAYPLYDEGSTGTDPVIAEQPLPDAVDPALGLSDPLTAWRSMEWRFHQGDPEQRGAYLRSVHLVGDADAALGAATNYSPPTQLSAFEYAFTGTLVGHEVGGTKQTGSLNQTLDVLTEADGTAVTQDLGTPWGGVAR